MADTTKNAGKTAPTSAPAAPTASAAPAEEKAKREKWQEVFLTAEAAVKAADDRTKGPRRAFKCTLNGKDVFVVANNEGRAGGVAYTTAGGTVEEIGKKAKAPKPVGVDGIMAAVNSLPEAEREAVLAQLKAIAGGKK